MRAGAHLLLMAANPINRGILRAVLERPLLLEEGRMIADFKLWEAALPAPLRSLYPAEQEPDAKIVALRRS